MTMLRDAVMVASTRPEIPAAVARIYADLQRQIDARKPICSASGRCCRFDEFGHRLYVTTIELAAFVASLPTKQPIQPTLGGCPFQIDGLCSVHTIRPFGCRVFFCDAASDQWQHAQYERFHADLKRLHEVLDVPYAYVEWREAIRQLQLDVHPICQAASGGPSQQGSSRLSLPQLGF